MDVLWDFENVAIPSTADAVTLAQAVIGVAAAFGTTGARRVFTKQSNISDATQATLKSAGFTVEMQKCRPEEAR